MSTSPYILRLYITGATHHSMLAVRNIKAICKAHLADNYELEIIDVYQQPELAGDQDIIAAPTLVKLSPDPKCKLIGDMSNTAKVLAALGLQSKV